MSYNFGFGLPSAQMPKNFNDPYSMNPGMNPYGYAQAPGQNNYGYYEQQTPAGSFAASNQQTAGASTAQNPYIGQTAQGIQGVSPTQAATAGGNPYLGQGTQQVNYQAAQGVGANPYSGQNTFLNNAIDSSSRDITKNFNDVVQPQMDRAMQQSGSFGNSGVQQAQGRAYDELGKTLANNSNNMRMQDYTAQQGLAENALNRSQGLNTFNAGNQLQSQLANSGFNAGDLNRQTGAFGTQGMFNAGQQNQMGQFNANNGLNTQQFNANLGFGDLGRNSQLMQSMGQFNAGALNNMGQFNAQQGNAINQGNTSAANNMIQNSQNRLQNQDQFNQNMDLNTYNANQNWMTQGQNNQLGFLDKLMNWQQGGINAATNQQNTPMNYWQQFMNASNQAGGLGGTGTSSQNLQGNPLLGLLGGALTGEQIAKLFGGG